MCVRVCVCVCVDAMRHSRCVFTRVCELHVCVCVWVCVGDGVLRNAARVCVLVCVGVSNALV